MSYGYPRGQTVHLAEATNQYVRLSIKHKLIYQSKYNNIDVDLDASDNIISGNDTSEMLNTSQSQKP